MLASNALVATFALFLLFCFTEISQGRENQPRTGVGGDDGITFGAIFRVMQLLRQGINLCSPGSQHQVPLPKGVMSSVCKYLTLLEPWTSTTMSRVTASRRPPIDPRNVACGKRKAGSRIVGGTDAQPGSWPWQVLVDFKAFQGPVWCGGSILTPYWIVTAAHCFDVGKNPTAFTVTVGEHDLRKVEGTEQTIPIDKIILHPKYKPSVTRYDYDVALIKLKKPIKFNSNVRPVCLPKKNFAPGTNCYVTGWGDTTEGGNIAQILQQAEVPLVSRDTCRRAYSVLKIPITKRMRCAGLSQGGVDSCQGDSGGPLVCPSNNKWYLMGVVSFGEGCARPNFFGVYSDMLVLKTWVQDTINKNPTP